MTRPPLWEVIQERTYIIAEMGAGHQGRVDLAKRIVDLCAWAGVDCVKGQKRCLTPGVLFSQAELDRPYESEHAFGATYGAHRAALELDWDQHEELRTYAEGKGIDYTVSVWDPVSAREAIGREYPWLKIPSACNQWDEVFDEVAGHPIVVSNGAMGLKQTATLIERLTSHLAWSAVLVCTSEYPCPPEHTKLGLIKKFCEDIVCGLSGHHVGIAIDMAAVALGARILERHVTLDEQLRGGDHSASLTVTELRALVECVRQVEKAMTANKPVYPGEIATMKKLRTEAMDG